MTTCNEKYLKTWGMRAFSEKYGKKDLIFVIVMVSLLLWFLWWVKYELPTAFDDVSITVGVVGGIDLTEDQESNPKTLVWFDVGEIDALRVNGHHSFPIGEKVIIIQHGGDDDRLRFTMEAWW